MASFGWPGYSTRWYVLLKAPLRVHLHYVTKPSQYEYTAKYFNGTNSDIFRGTYR